MPEPAFGATRSLVFAGTPDFAVPALQACLASPWRVAAVYTQPDRRSGRGRRLRAGPVKQVALEAGVPVEQPVSLKEDATQAGLAHYQPDLLVVVAYGLILPQAVLDIPRHGCWNVHASLLPRWRGAAPVQRAIAAGDTETGVALMQMDAGLDTGPVLAERRTPIGADETGGSLHDRLAELGGELLAEGLAAAAAEEPFEPTPQQGEPSYAHKLDKREAVLDFSRPAKQLERQVRAFHPWPVAETSLDGERVRIHAAHALGSDANEAPGSVLGMAAQGVDIACAEGVLRVTRLQLAGGRPMPVADYLNARRGGRGRHA